MNKKKIENQKVNDFLPKKWRKMKLGDVLTFQRGYDLPRKKMCNGKVPVAGSNGIIGYHNTKTTDGPGVTIGRSGSIGKPTFYKNDFWAHNTTLYVKNFYGNDEKFIFYLIQALDLSKFNSGSAVPTLNRNHIHELKVIIPSLIDEQKKIVEILSTWDQAIEKLDRLILAKEKQFKWLLKKLITDQKNNPKRKEVKIGRLIQTIKPTKKIQNKNFKSKGIYPIIDQSQSNIAGWTDDEEAVVNINQPVVVFGDHTCSIKYVDQPFAQGADGIKILKTNFNVLPKFLYFSLLGNPMKTDGYKRHFSKLKRYVIFLPRLEVQKKVVKILSECEKDIKILKQLSRKYEDQKKGLMQKLLTGKIRLQ